MNKRHSTEQIVAKLRQADIELGKVLKVREVGRQLGGTEQTYYRWRQKYGGMDPQMAKYVKQIEKENARLRKLVAGPGNLCCRSARNIGRNRRGVSVDFAC